MSDIADIAEPLTAGQMLKIAREATGLTQDQVAQELYLTPNYIRLIDSDEIDKIAKQAFVRGYLRSYAKLVQINDDEVVAQFERSQGGVQPKIEIRRVTRESVGSTNFTGPVFQTGVLGLVGLVVVIALVWYLTTSEEEAPVTVGPAVSSVIDRNSAVESGNGLVAGDDGFDSADIDTADTADFETDGDLDAAESTVTPGVKVSAEEAPEASTPQTTPQASLQTYLRTPPETAAELIPGVANDDQAGEITSNINNDINNDINNNINTNTDSAPASSVATNFNDRTPIDDEAEVGREIDVQRVGNLINVAAGGDDELRFFFSDECWIEIEDSAGDSIYGDLNRSGDELVVSGTAPFEVLFGKAPAVTMEYNGVPIDLVPHTTSVDTAKLKVGN